MEIKKAYKKKSLEFHPDRIPPTATAEEKQKRKKERLLIKVFRRLRWIGVDIDQPDIIQTIGYFKTLLTEPSRSKCQCLLMILYGQFFIAGRAVSQTQEIVALIQSSSKSSRRLRKSDSSACRFGFWVTYRST